MKEYGKRLSMHFNPHNVTMSGMAQSFMHDLYELFMRSAVLHFDGFNQKEKAPNAF